MTGTPALPDPVPAARLAADRTRQVEAAELAWLWHGEQTRKGRVTSYMSHLAQVQGLVIRAGGGPDEAVAALLHDGLEDAPDAATRAARERQIEDRFGAGVLRIVLDCTDTRPDEAAETKGPWRERKERYLDQLRRAEPDSLLVAGCDKLQNLSDLVSDLRYEGPATLERFNAGPEDQLWYFTSLVGICEGSVPERLQHELDAQVEAFRALTGVASAKAP